MASPILAPLLLIGLGLSSMGITFTGQALGPP
jgi:hypothetical protein